MAKRNEFKLIMDAAGIDLALARITAEIIEKLTPAEEFAVVGIRRRGVHLAERLCAKLEGILRRSIRRGKTVINLFVEPSTRTRSSFELAEKRLSADIWVCGPPTLLPWKYDRLGANAGLRPERPSRR